MSSTLFGRGTNSQIGGKKRADDQDRAVLSVRTAVDELKIATAADVRATTTRIAALEANLATLQATVAALQKAATPPTPDTTTTS
jgi:hypothetical protein